MLWRTPMNLRLPKDGQARKWLLIKSVDVLLVAISTPLAFYVALVYDKGGLSTVFMGSMALLIAFSTIGVLITWHVWEAIKRSTEGAK